MNTGWLGVIKTDGVPILIVTVLLALYSFLVITGHPSNQHLETMTAMVAAFYFGGKTVAASAESVRSTAAAISGSPSHDDPDTTGPGAFRAVR